MSEIQSGEGPEVTRLKKLLARKEPDKLEAEWMAVVDAGALDLEEAAAVLDVLSHRDEAGHADTLFWYYLTVTAERRGAEEAVAAVRRAAGMMRGSAELREETAGVYERAYADVADVGAMTKMTLRREDLPYPAAVARMDLLLKLRPGTCVKDTRLEELGHVVGLKADKGLLEVALGERTRTYDAVALERIEALPEDDLRAMLVSRRDVLEAMARDDAAGLVRLVLGTFGPRVEMRELKSCLGAVIPAEAWSKWWTAARPQLKRDPLIELGGEGTKQWFFLRAKPVAYADEFKEQLVRTEEPEEKLMAIIAHLEEGGHEAESEAALEAHLAAELEGWAAAWQEKNRGAALGAAALAARMRRRLAGGDGAAPGETWRQTTAAMPPVAPMGEGLKKLLAEGTDLAAALRTLSSEKLGRWILEAIRETMPERWSAVCLEALLGCSQTTCDWIAGELCGHGRAAELRVAVEAVLERPERHAGAAVWMWKAACAGDYPEALGGVELATVAIRLLVAADGLTRDTSWSAAQRQSLLKQISTALAARNYDGLRAVLKDASGEQATRAHQATERNAGLTETTRVRVLEIITATHPKLFFKAVPAWEEDVIYTTAAGLAKRREEFAYLINVKMAANAKAIGDAAAYGDLSENAEFTAALEERNNLTEKASRLEAELKKVRTITAATAAGESVTVGSAVRVRHVTTGREETWKFLGPWDSNPEQGVFSYRAALALQFMGHKVGEQVETPGDGPDRLWEIAEIRPGVET
jgi:transcription elongation GreA/GreB family factor